MRYALFTALIGISLFCYEAAAGNVTFSYRAGVTNQNVSNLPAGTILHGVIEIDPLVSSSLFGGKGVVFRDAITLWELWKDDQLIGRATEGDAYVDDGGTVPPPRGGGVANPNPNDPDHVTLTTNGSVHDPAFVIQTIAGEFVLNSMQLSLSDPTGAALSGEHLPTGELTSSEFAGQRYLTFGFLQTGRGATFVSATILAFQRTDLVPEPSTPMLACFAGSLVVGRRSSR